MTPRSSEALTTIQSASGEADRQERAHRSSPCSRARSAARSAAGTRRPRSASTVMSSSAAIAEPGESSKNVRTSCLQRRPAGVFRLHRGKVDEARPVVLAREQAAVDHDLEQLAHAGRARRIGQLGADLLDRRAAAAVEDLHDLALAAGEVDGVGLGMRLGLRDVEANIFAYGEYIRLWRALVNGRAPPVQEFRGFRGSGVQLFGGSGRSPGPQLFAAEPLNS